MTDTAQPSLFQSYRGFIQGKTRIVTAWVAAFAVGLAAQAYPTWPGLFLCFLGATLRFWASGYLRKDSRPAVGGPYAWIRNPLYLGTYLMALGALWAVEAWVLLAVVSIVFAAIYHFIILDEENKLRRILGEPYLQYLKLVPRFFPRPWPAPSRKLQETVNPVLDQHRFSWDLAMKNKAYEAYASLLGIAAWLVGCAYLWQTFRPVSLP